MLTQQSAAWVEVPRRELLDLRGNIKNLMRKHNMMRDDLCHLGASKCHFGLNTRWGEVQVKPPTIAYPALHAAILGLVSYVHVGKSMQTSCAQPILHSVTRPSRPIRDSLTTGHPTSRSLSSAYHHPLRRSLT